MDVTVVGKTARGDRFSLNGFGRQAKSLSVRVAFASPRDTSSNGNATAHSVPSMFANYRRDRYSDDKARYTENLLAILQRVGATAPWRDNNLNLTWAAKRVSFEDCRSPEFNPV